MSTPSGPAAAPPGRWTVAAAALACGMLLLATRSLQQPPDGLDYALAIRSGESLFHPHHLLFAPACRAVLLASSGMIPAVDAVLAAQLHNILWGLAAAFGCGAAAWSLCRSRAAAFAAAGLMLAARGGWVYSVQVEVYIPAAGALALAAALLAGAGPRPLGLGVRWAAAALLAAATLYHQTNALFCIPLVAGLAAGRGVRGAADGTWICLTGGIIVLAAYAAAFAASGGASAADFPGWCLGYALEPVPEWGSWSHFGLAGLRDLLASQGANVVAVPAGLEWPAALATGAALALIGLWHLRRLLTGAPQRTMRALLLAWPAAYFIFFLWWLPTDTDFFVATLPPLVLQAVWAGWEFGQRRGIGRMRPRLTPAAVAAAVALLAAVNLAFTVLPLHRSAGPHHETAAELAAAFPAADIFACGYGVNQNLRYHFGKRVLDPAEPLRDLYAGLPLPRVQAPDPAATIVADAALLSPRFAVGDSDGLKRPGPWRRAMAWLLAIETDPAERTIRARPVARREVGGAAYLLIGPAETTDAPLDGILAQLAGADIRPD